MKTNLFNKIFRNLLVAIMIVTFVLIPIVRADSAKAYYTQADLDAANKKKAAAEAAAAQKRADALAMQVRVNAISSQIDQAVSDIGVTADKISAVLAKIKDFDKQILEKQSDLDRQQEQMSEVVASWYMQGESGLLETVVTANNLSDVMDKQQYYESLRQQIQSNSDEVKRLQNDLNSQKNDKTVELQSLNDLQSNQATQKASLDANKNFKNALMANDKTAAANYDKQAQIAQAEADKISQELRKAYCQADGGTWVNGICSNGRLGGPAIHKGSGGIQLSVPYYSQQDPSWASKSMGTSGVSIGAAGCLMTSLAMVASSQYVGLSENPASLVDKSIFQSSGSSAGNFLGFKYNMGKLDGYEQAKGGANLDVIDSQLKRGHPVVVKVAIPSSSLYHWIVVTGGDQGHGYSWNDPWPWRNPPFYTHFYNMRTFD